MLIFFPFFLHYYIGGKYGKSSLFLLLMAMSHLTFIFLAIPVLLHSLRKFNKTFIITGVIIGIVFPSIYLLTHQMDVIKIQRMTNLNYLFVDIPLLLFAVISLFRSKFNLYNIIFVFNVIATLLLFLYSAEAWRMFVLLNIPMLLSAINFIDKQNNKILNYILIFYLIGISILFSVYAISLEPAIIKIGGKYLLINP